MNVDDKAIIKIITVEKTKDLLEKNTIFTEVWQVIFSQYTKFMEKTHLRVEPLTPATLSELCKKIGKNPNDYKFNTVSNLLKNACMA